jgi:hypothetical protein
MSDTKVIQLPEENTNGLYVGFRLTPERIGKGAYATTCKRCSKFVGHYPVDSVGHDVICLSCADEIPAIRKHMDELAKARGE